jgi:hypothetical protein
VGTVRGPAIDTETSLDRFKKTEEVSARGSDVGGLASADVTHSKGGAGLSADSVTVDIGRASILAIVMAVVVLGGLAAAGLYAALDTRDSTERAIGFGVAILFASPVVLMLAVLPKLRRPRGLAFDRDGVHYWQGSTSLLLAWHEVAAIGIGYEQPPELPSLSLSLEDAVKGYVADKLKDALKIDGKRRVAVEIFPADPQAVQRYPILARYRREQQPPAAGLSPVRWRLPLPPVLGVARGVERGMRSFQQQRWLGWFARPWSGGLIR